jgi:phosphoglycolate phosphatase
MHRYRLLIFDFDGTLADSGNWMIRTLNDVAEQFGLRRVSDEEVAMLRGRSSTEVIRYLRVPVWKLPGIAAEMRRRVARDLDQIELFDGVAATLQTLHARGFKLALVSSNAEDNVRRLLGAANAACFDAFECSASMFGKPHKLRAVMKRLGTAPAQTLYIGDETRDIDAAREVGAASGAVTWGYATPEILRQSAPTHVFESFAQIAQLESADLQAQ